MRSKAVRFLKRGAVMLGLLFVVILALRTYLSLRGPPLELWHTYVPHDMTAKEIRTADWSAYLAAESALFEEVRANVTDKLEGSARNPANRYFAGSPLYPGHFSQDWNRSFILEPDQAPVGAVVFLHGLTDAPYSGRGIARHYRDHGWVTVAIRLPGHGTVPGGLTAAQWEDWSEATRLAVREARRRVGQSRPLHLIGYSNGGALAMKYALDAIDDNSLSRPDRIVLVSPMIGITNLARFAGVFGWPAVFPAFEKTAWLGIVPEFNPFKYNSFPVNGARQSSLMSRALQRQIAQHERDGRLVELPPVLTFQSAVDFTVSTRAIVDALYVHLPANGSELVLFDLNRSAAFGPLLRSNADTMLSGLLPDPPRRFRTAIITNAGPESRDMVERATEAGAAAERTRALTLSYPVGVFSLSHIALPFPIDDPLYGMQPDKAENFGVNLGALPMRGEREILVVSVDSLTRMSSNPFFPYMLERIDQGAAQPQAR